MKTTLLVLAGVVIATLVVGRQCQNLNAAWEQRLAAAQAVARAERERAQEALDGAAELSRLAQEYASEADSVEVEIRDRIETVRVETPPDLVNHPAIVQRDEIIVDLQGQVGLWKAAYELETEATMLLTGSLTGMVAVVDSLNAVIDDRPGQRPWWVPHLSVGPQAGLGIDSRPYTGVGATLGWEIKL